MPKIEKHYIQVKVPLDHRFESRKTLSNGKPNKYFLAQKIANKHHRGSVGGGGCAMWANDYEISVRMPITKLKAFRTELKTNGIRSKDWGKEE